MADYVRITDVAPRDGLQNEPGVIPTADKARLVQLLCATGVDEVEVTSFVSPKWIPQLGDAADVLVLSKDSKPKSLVFSVLVPNEQGMAAALETNQRAGTQLIDKASVFTAASETFSKRNTNAGIAESIERFVPVARSAKRHGLSMRIYVSCAIACPFEGPIAPANVARVVELLGRVQDAYGDACEIDLGDTIGAATPGSTRALLEAILPRTTPRHTVLHFHDTFGAAAACVRAAITMGVRSFDGSAGGLGGCPYASTPGLRAPGNISTQALVKAALEAGLASCVDPKAMDNAGAFALGLVMRTPEVRT